MTSPCFEEADITRQGQRQTQKLKFSFLKKKNQKLKLYIFSLPFWGNVPEPEPNKHQRTFCSVASDLTFFTYFQCFTCFWKPFYSLSRLRSCLNIVIKKKILLFSIIFISKSFGSCIKNKTGYGAIPALSFNTIYRATVTFPWLWHSF